MIIIHYFYTNILRIGLAISTILYIGFSLILLILWCFLKVLVESISSCSDCCKKKISKKIDNNVKTNNNVKINNNNVEINNNNQKEKEILSINKPKEREVEKDDFDIEDIKNEENNNS